MAAQVFNVSYQLTDYNGAPTSFELLMSVSTGLYADAVSAANEFASFLDGLTNSQITRIIISAIPGVPSGLKTTPTAGYNNSDGALFDFSDTAFGRAFSRFVPNTKPEAFLATDPKRIDPEDPSPAYLFINAMVSEITANAVAINSEGATLTRYRSGLKSSRKQRRQLSRLRNRIGV